MTYTVKTTSGAKGNFTRELRGFVTDRLMGHLPAADAYAIVTSHSVDDLRRDTIKVEDIGTRFRKTPLRVDCNVEVMDSTYKSQTLTAKALLADLASKWMGTILSQKPWVEDLHNRVDIATAWISKLDETCDHDP
ncbi:uncharacterized protein RHO25_002249 [Cercospora beticola]|uniref:Uncharacterized protein n=1 Tax=Cercospora beticola TaxID=122368 RepID=A0ABZ0NDM5_CERBT|nr:hypothetical protein RHO25_002249 [Cercospora beticola]